MTESVSGRDIPERMESASLLLARVVTSHEEQRLTRVVDDTDRDRELEPVLLELGVSSCRDTCTHCDCPWGALLW